MLWEFSQISVLSLDYFGKLAAKEMVCAHGHCVNKGSALASKKEQGEDTDVCVCVCWF